MANIVDDGAMPDQLRSGDAEERLRAEASAHQYRPAPVNAATIDAAVDKVLDGVDPRHADAMRRMMAVDVANPAAIRLFSDSVATRLKVGTGGFTKRRLVVREVLTRDELALVVRYAPEYDLEFRSDLGNEHGLFSARRGIDHAIITRRIPSGERYLDFGGNLRKHVQNGDTECVTVAPFDMDAKDGARLTMTKMTLKRLLAGSEKPVVKAMAESVLSGKDEYFVNTTVQKATVKAGFSVAVHVYDVPIQDWPDMMERCGVRVHEGCVHFSSLFFERTSGTIPGTSAMFEIDNVKDLFRMRVGGSSAAWYEHKWTDFMRYGVDQVIHTKRGSYSYKITERRDDTLFYRILPIGGGAVANVQQYYALPDVPMVEVSGFEVSQQVGLGGRERTLVPRVHVFPAGLWQVMLNYAAVEWSRGSASYERIYNYYRTVVPAQVFNNVRVYGGQSVPMDDIPALVISASAVAYADSLLQARTVRTLTDDVEARRAAAVETTSVKVARAFVASFRMMNRQLVWPFGRSDNTVTDELLERVVSWRPVVTLKRVNAATLLSPGSIGYQVEGMPSLNAPRVRRGDAVGSTASLIDKSSDFARAYLNMHSSHMSPEARQVLESRAKSSSISGTTAVEPGGTSDSPGESTYMDGDVLVKRVVKEKPPFEARVAYVRNAILEAIAETTAEYQALESTCDRICRQVLVGGQPMVKVLIDRKEEYFDADLWLVVKGVITESVLGSRPDRFAYSGVFLPVPQLRTDRIVPVEERPWDGDDHVTGQPANKMYFMVPGDYNGYVLTCDSLKVFNGPAITRVLELAVRAPDEALDIDVTAHSGPPGCGKTTTIIKRTAMGSTVCMTPTRVARGDLVNRLVKEHNASLKTVRDMCRTLDSSLVNYNKFPDDLRATLDQLLMDEYVLARAGKTLAIAVVLGVKVLHVFGDPKQINHIPRVAVASLYARLHARIEETRFVTYRCCAVVLAMFNRLYGFELRTLNTEDGECHWVSSLDNVLWRPKTRLLCMYQADKKFLNTFVKTMAEPPEVSTVHEAQGTDCDHTVLYNGELRKRGPEDKFYLYGVAQMAHAIVSVSRSRKTFTYVKESRELDAITAMIADGQNPLIVSGGKDMKTQGSAFRVSS